MNKGRPKLDNPRSKQYRLRLNDEEREKLEYLSERTGKTVSEILRFGVDLMCSYYDFSDRKESEDSKKYHNRE